MSTVTRGDVERLAALARLELNPEEIQTFARQLTDVLEFVRQIQAVDTSLVIVPPAPADNISTVRDDTILPSLNRAEVLSGAPAADRAAGVFKVPRVLNG